MPSIEPTLEDFRTLLLITYHCEIANEDEFQRMLQKTAYPYSNEEFWNDSKRHEVKNNSPFAFRNEKDEMLAPIAYGLIGYVKSFVLAVSVLCVGVPNVTRRSLGLVLDQSTVLYQRILKTCTITDCDDGIP
ncbi:hypothetical protein FSP39_024041 [Pinctada imbricata]|uniref:Uncharacterized protein n=1 Tax=Pinctada imbricata TaxID=66713 RepID=A0AA89BN28_PINIB|nr:hypothetical protein FSP39_024041 [Pinctada imbricata]